MIEIKEELKRATMAYAPIHCAMAAGYWQARNMVNPELVAKYGQPFSGKELGGLLLLDLAKFGLYYLALGYFTEDSLENSVARVGCFFVAFLAGSQTLRFVNNRIETARSQTFFDPEENSVPIKDVTPRQKLLT